MVTVSVTIALIMVGMNNPSDSSFFQVVICRRQPGASPGDVARLSGALQRWVTRQPGFLARRLVACSDGVTYVDLIEWSDAASAQASAGAEGHPDAGEMGQILSLDAMTFLQGAAVPPSP